MSEPKKSSENSGEQSSEIKIEVRCLECFEVLWVTTATVAGEPRVMCPFKQGGKCLIKAKGCGCG